MAESTNKPRWLLSDQFQYILAIDLGTIYSGYAYKHKDDISLETGKIDIDCSQVWHSGRANFISHKTSTCILLNSNKELVSFGYQAENKYVKMQKEAGRKEFYFFRRFKMVLYDKPITNDLSLTDEIGKTLPAKLVFGKSIYALTQYFFESMKKQGIHLKSNEVRYVLTVPAIWSDAAKQFMREAAVEAGIKNEELLIALEPEAASIYSQFVKSKDINDLRLTLTITGTRYLVADLGGGTVDIAVHEKLNNGFLKEIYRCRGEGCGGDSINSALLRELTRIIGAPILTKIKEENPTVLVELYREFEAAKKTVDGESDDDFEVRLPFHFLDHFIKQKMGETLNEIIHDSPFNSDMRINIDSLCIKQSVVIETLFKPTKDKVIQLLKDVILQVEGNNPNTKTKIAKILLVGGFSDSKYIQNAVRENFSDKLVITPELAELCVLKGAVLFGHSPDLISHRVVRLTYGIRANKTFNCTEHDEKCKFTANGKEFCSNIFYVYATCGSVVEIGTTITRQFRTIYPHQKDLTFSVFTSLSSSPKYTDADDCEKVGQLSIEISEPTKDLRSYDVSLIFGNTEITILAKDALKGKEETANINFILY